MKHVAHAERVALDSSLFIYHFEAHPRYGELTIPLFSFIERGMIFATASLMTYSEILVVPKRLGNQQLVSRYRTFFSAAPPTFLLEVPSLQTAEVASDLRAKYHGLRLPDAFVLASAVTTQTRLFITNDRALAKKSEVPTLVLDDYLPKRPRKER